MDFGVGNDNNNSNDNDNDTKNNIDDDEFGDFDEATSPPIASSQIIDEPPVIQTNDNNNGTENNNNTNNNTDDDKFGTFDDSTSTNPISSSYTIDDESIRNEKITVENVENENKENNDEFGTFGEATTTTPITTAHIIVEPVNNWSNNDDVVADKFADIDEDTTTNSIPTTTSQVIDNELMSDFNINTTINEFENVEHAIPPVASSQAIEEGVADDVPEDAATSITTSHVIIEEPAVNTSSIDDNDDSGGGGGENDDTNCKNNSDSGIIDEVTSTPTPISNPHDVQEESVNNLNSNVETNIGISDEFGDFDEAPTTITPVVPEEPINSYNNNIEGDALNANKDINGIDDNDDEFGDFDEATTVTMPPSQIIEEPIQNPNTHVTSDDNDDEFGDFDEAIPTTTTPTTTAPIQDEGVTVRGNNEDDDWGDFDAAPSSAVTNEVVDQIVDNPPPPPSSGGGDEDDWGDFDEGAPSTAVSTAPTPNKTNDLPLLSEQEIQKIELETIIKLQKLDKFTTLVPPEQLLSILASQHLLTKTIHNISSSFLAETGNQSIYFHPSAHDSDLLIKNSFEKNYHLPTFIQQNFQASSTSQTNSCSEWTSNRIHNLLLNTLPVDAIPVTALREPTFSKPSLAFVALTQKKNSTSISPEDENNQIDNDGTKDYQITNNHETGRRFSLTESQFPSDPPPKENTGHTSSSKENEMYGSNTSSSGSGSSSVGLSSAAQQYLKTLPDMSYMLIVPKVENGKE